MWVGCCPGGIHPGFLQWAEVTDHDELERAVRSRYSLTGHNSIMLRELVRHARVVLYSELPPEQVLQMGLVPAASLEEGLSLATSGLARDFSTAVISRGNVTASMLDLP